MRTTTKRTAKKASTRKPAAKKPVVKPFKTEQGVKAVFLKDVKNDEYFTLNPYDYPNENQVWKKCGYDRSEKKYYCYNFADGSKERWWRGDKIVYVNFYF